MDVQETDHVDAESVPAHGGGFDDLVVPGSAHLEVEFCRDRDTLVENVDGRDLAPTAASFP